MPADGSRLPPQPRLDVLTADGKQLTVRGRAARLILWLAQHEQGVNDKRRGELTFAFKDDLTSWKLLEAGESL